MTTRGGSPSESSASGGKSIRRYSTTVLRRDYDVPGVWDSREIATTICDECLKLVEDKVIGRMSLTAEIKEEGTKRHV
jgi:hypothetical protein